MKGLRIVILLGLLLLTGCFSLSRDEPPQRRYVLGGQEQPQNRMPTENLEGLSVGLRQVQLAEYLESPFILVREGPNRVGFSEFHRWGEQLSGGINRAVAYYLAARAPFGAVDVVPWPPRKAHDFLIQLHIERFEGLAPEEQTAPEGAVSMLATWEIICSEDGVVLSRGTTDYRRRGWTVGDYDSLVTLLDAGLSILADDLVASLNQVAAP